MPTEPFVAFPIWDQRQFSLESNDCAVLMPFDVPALEAVFRDAIAPSILAVGLKPARADRSVQPKVVDHIWTMINQAHLVVADITGANPNVLYELGVAHTIGKPAVILRSDPAPAVPFDVRALRSIKYNASSEGLPELAAELEQALRQLLTAHPSGHRLLDEVESAAGQWRGPSRDFSYLYVPERLGSLQRFIPPAAMSDYAVAFCAASACQWGVAGHMVLWGGLCNERPAAAVDLGFGIFNHQRRPRLRIAHLLCQFEPPVRTQVVSRLTEHGLKGEILKAIRDGDVAGYVASHRDALGLSSGALDELMDLFRNSQLVFSRALP